MKAEDAKKIADNALKQLTDSLKAGKSERLIQYLAMLAKFHRYSFGNVLMIADQRPDATCVAGFNTWKQLGRHVKKGEKGIVIIAPMAIRPQSEPPEDARTDKPTKPILRFRGVHVFDVSQTEGKELPAPSTVGGDPAHHLDCIKALVTSHGISLAYADLSQGTDGLSHGGRVTIRNGLTPANEFAVIAHELAHELLHKGTDRPTSKTIRETEAEAVAFVVCQAIGLTTSTASSDYIQLYQGNAETLALSLERIQRTAAGIISPVLGTGIASPA